LLRLGQDGDLLQLEAEVTDAAQQPVQLRLVGDLADEVGVAAAVPGGHPVKGACQSRTQAAADGDPDLLPHRASSLSASFA
jgi:hypothetical protein